MPNGLHLFVDVPLHDFRFVFRTFSSGFPVIFNCQVYLFMQLCLSLKQLPFKYFICFFFVCAFEIVFSPGNMLIMNATKVNKPKQLFWNSLTHTELLFIHPTKMVVMIFDTWSMSNFSANNISATDKKKFYHLISAEVQQIMLSNLIFYSLPFFKHPKIFAKKLTFKKIPCHLNTSAVVLLQRFCNKPILKGKHSISYI